MAEQVVVVPDCVLCNQPLLETEAKIQIHCGHSFHTNCFLIDEMDTCLICEAFVVPGRPLDRRLRNRRGSMENRVKETFESNADFQTEIKEYVKLRRLCGRKRTAFAKVAKEKKNEVNGTIESLRQQIKMLLTTSKRQIMATQAAKDYKSILFRRQMIKSKIFKKYGYEMKCIRIALADKPGFRRWGPENYYSFSTSSILRRSFYRRYIRV